MTVVNSRVHFNLEPHTQLKNPKQKFSTEKKKQKKERDQNRKQKLENTRQIDHYRTITITDLLPI